MRYLKLIRRIINKIKTTTNKKATTGSPFIEELLSLDAANEKIAQMLDKEGGVMIARYGNTELMTVANYMGIKAGKHPLKYILGKQDAWWWDPYNVKLMGNAGFFHSSPDDLKRFCELIINDSKHIDLLGSWVQNERILADVLANTIKTRLTYLEPYFSKNPWTSALKGKKVLVVHPFARSIQEQYNRRELLFENKEVLPEFASLKIIPAVQSIGAADPRFKDWFDALEWMKQEVDKSDYDVCIIGCGAYGFPLAAHVKRQGKKAVHLGGALQLLFGIKGNRWEREDYGVPAGFKPGQYKSLPNEYWIRPHADERPAAASNVEGACYW